MSSDPRDLNSAPTTDSLSAVQRPDYSPEISMLIYHKKHSELLIQGFVRLYEETYDFGFIPTELVQIIIDLYYPLHFQWMNRNITLQITNHKEGDDQKVYFNGDAWNYRKDGIVGVSSHPMMNGMDCSSAIWRMYPLSDHSKGFTLRPVNTTETEDVAKHPDCRYLAPRGLDKRDKALSLQLVRPEHGGVDEYYFQNMDDGQYLVVEYEEEAIDRDPYVWPSPPRSDFPSLHFVDSPSEATLFRIMECGPLRNADLDLRCGSWVSYTSPVHDDQWVEAQVIDLRQSAFGREVRLKYGGFSILDAMWFNGKTDWIPAESYDIGEYALFDPVPESVVEEAYRRKDGWNGTQIDAVMKMMCKFNACGDVREPRISSMILI